MMNGGSPKTRFLYWLIIAAGVYALLPFILIAPYNQPAADDFYGAMRDAHKSFSAVFVYTYFNWSGRYFATLISRVNPLLFNSGAAYKWYPVVLLLAFAAALAILVRTLTKQYFNRPQSLALAAMLLYLYLAVLPGTAEGFYWFSAACIYQIANIFFMLLVAALVRLQSKLLKHRFIYFLAAALLAVCIIGCNEISLIIACSLMLLFALSKYKVAKRPDALFIVLCALSLIAACVAVLAPGNFGRLNDAQQYAKSPLWAFAGAAGIMFYYFTQWAAPLLVATVLYVPLFGHRLAQKMKGRGEEVPVKFPQCFIIFILLFLLLHVFAVWVAGASNIGRIENVIYLYFLLGWFFNVQVIINNYVQGQRQLSYFSKPLKGVVVLLFFMTVADINNNISTAYIDVLSGKAKIYSKELDERMRMVRHSADDTCYVPPLTALPKTIFFTDIKCTTDSANFWMNDVYAAWAGKKYVLVTAPLPPTQSNTEALKDVAKNLREGFFNKGK